MFSSRLPLQLNGILTRDSRATRWSGRKHHACLCLAASLATVLSSFGNVFDVLYMYVSCHFSDGLPKVSRALRGWTSLPVQRRNSKTRRPSDHRVRKRLRSSFPMRCERAETHRRPFFQLHQRVLQYRPL